MKTSVSSVLAERIKQRRAVTPTKHGVRHVKFSPEEMAYDVPEDTSHFVPIGRGSGDFFAKPTKTQMVVRLDADIAKVFKNADAVNRALRKLIEAMPTQSPRRRKTA
jgi:uncharacterized protein (DUF4415 family)